MLKGIIAVKLALLLPYYMDHETQMINLQIGFGLQRLLVIFFLFGRSFGEEKELQLFLEWYSAFSHSSSLLCGRFSTGTLSNKICFS